MHLLAIAKALLVPITVVAFFIWNAMQITPV
jgi:hypothetical protein